MTLPKVTLKEELKPEDFGGFWIRVEASFLDGLILVVPSIIMGKACAVIAGSNKSMSFHLLQLGMGIFVGLVYFGFFQAYQEGSLGKKVLGLAVVSEHGETLSVGQAAGRFFMQYPCSLSLGLGYLWVGWDRFKQGWHDKTVGSVVVSRKALNEWRKEQGQGSHPDSLSQAL